MFQKHVGSALDAGELDEFTRLLAHVVAIELRRGRWDRKMPQLRMDPQDFSQDCLAWLVRKTKGGLNMKHQAPLVLMRILFVTIHHRITDAVNESNRRTSREIAETDFYRVSGNQDDSGAAFAPAESPEVSDVLDAMDDAEDKVLGPIICPASQLDAATRLFNVLRLSLRHRHGLAAYWELPLSVRDLPGVTLELYAYVKFRFARFLADQAGD